MARSDRTVEHVVREIMAGLPEAEEFVSHGSPTFRVRGKIFATFTVNHHGDGRVALNVMAPPGVQAALAKIRPDVYFVPPYVGPRGWLGIELNKGLAWDAVRDHVIDAYSLVAPPVLAKRIQAKQRITPPTRDLRPEEIDPLQGRFAKAVVARLDAIAGALPETEAGTQFGAPIWKAGTKTFVIANFRTGRLALSFWVGAKRQAGLIKDSRFSISPYLGHHGWMDLNVEHRQDWDEIQQLVLESYRHFALKRMLSALAPR